MPTPSAKRPATSADPEHGKAPAAGAPSPASPLAHATGLVGDRWTLLVIDALLDAPLRFGDLQERVGGIAPNILTQRLRLLEQHGLVAARPYSSRPVRMAYEVTEPARDLAAALHLLAEWGSKHAPTSTEGDDHQRHCASCGSTVEYRPWCPTCDRPLDHGEVSDVHWA